MRDWSFYNFMLTVIASIVLAHAGAQAYNPSGPAIKFTMANGKSFVVTTDPKTSPKTVSHVLALVKKGFYDRQRIHRVESWVTQWGAPASKNEPMMVKGKDGKMSLNDKVGDGGSGHDIPFEGSQTIDFVRGVVGIASEGLQMGGDSQLFVLKKDTLRLFNSYAILGKVSEGMATVDAIKFGDRITKASVIGAKAVRKH